MPTAVFAAALVLLLIAGVSAWRQFQDFRTQRQALALDLTVLAVAEELDALLKDAETGQRGYLLTEDSRHLKQYGAAASAVPQRLAHLRAILRRHPEQQQDVAQLELLVRQRLARLQSTLDVFRSQGKAAALRSVRENPEGDSGLRAQALLDRVEARERQEGQARFAAAETAYRQALLSMGALMLLALVPLCGAMVLVNRSMGQRHSAETAQRQQSELLRSVLDTMGDGVLIADADGRLMLWNPAAEQAYGISGAVSAPRNRWSELFGLYYPGTDKLFPTEELPLFRVLRGEIVQNALLEARPTGAEESRWVRVSGHPLCGPGNESRGAVLVLRDVTREHESAEELRRSHETLEDRVMQRTAELERVLARHRAGEAALRASQALFGNFMDYNPALAFIRDGDFRLIYANASYERFFAADLKDLTGSMLSDMLPDDIADRLHAHYRRVLAEWRALEVQETIPDPRGKPHECIFYLFPIRDASGDPHVGGLVVDMSSQRMLEKQLVQAQKMEVVGRLAGGIAHDFNNLITLVSGYSDLLLRNLQNPVAARGYVEEIQKAGSRAASLTRQLLAFSRQQVLAPEVLDLNALIGELQSMLRRLIGEDVQLSVVLHAQLNPVRADPTQIEQVLMNLAINARDAMPQGGQLTIEGSNVSVDGTFAEAAEVRPGEYVLLTVTDTGCGMDAETLAHAFEPFFTTKSAGKGTGLGLATVFGVIKQSEGHVTVYSEVGLGTAFRIYLPAITKPAEVAAPVRPPQEAHGGRETILLVEDEPALRALVAEALRTRGYTVLVASNGRQALEVVQEHEESIDLLVTDVVMPEKGGRPLAEELRDEQPDLRVLFMSGYTSDTVLRHGVLEEGSAFLQKPFTIHTLINKVRELLDGDPDEMPAHRARV